jgi:hypothetical protein
VARDTGTGMRTTMRTGRRIPTRTRIGSETGFPPTTPGREMRNLRDVILTRMTGFLPRQHKARIHLFGDGTSARMLPGCGVRTNRDVSGEFAGRVHGPMV